MKIRKGNIINYIIAIIFIILAIVLVIQLSVNSNSNSEPSIKEEAQEYLKEKFEADTKVFDIYHAPQSFNLLKRQQGWKIYTIMCSFLFIKIKITN